MLVDVFLYNGEADMLDLRRRTLEDHVDAMVAVTCTLTHQSDPNPVPDIPEGIGHLVCDPVPIPEGRGGRGTPWYQWIERQHRDWSAHAVQALSLAASDLVMISDVDEIPDPSSLEPVNEPSAVPMRMHGFAIDYLHPATWVGTTISRADQVAPQAHRDWRYQLPRVGGGWHLSWFGDLDEKRTKLASFSHAELADLDVDSCFREGVHANGEQMARLSRTEVEWLHWPAPLFNGFEIPAAWWAPEDSHV